MLSLVTPIGSRATKGISLVPLFRVRPPVKLVMSSPLSSAIAAAAADSVQVGRQIDVYRAKRQESQPREPSAGCIFKNPENDSAGRLIDACGLKGERIGGAEVSTIHGNFIVNQGGATSADVIELVRRIRESVARQTGVLLQPEVLLYGADWEDVL